MESLVFLSACLKKDVAQGIIVNLEPFANIDEQDGVIYYRAIITLKLLFALHTMKNAFPELLSQLMLVIGNVYVATANPEIAVLPAISLCFQLFSPFKGRRLVWYITMTFMGAISMNIRQYEFILDIYVLISILWYAFETYNREIQKLCSVVSVVLTVGWYACKEYVKNPILLNKFSICAFLVLAYGSLRPNRGNKHRHRLLYFYAIFFMWLLYQFHHIDDSKFHVIENESNKTHSDVSCTDSMFKHGGSEKLLYHTNLKNVLSVENIDNGTCSKWHDSLKDSISTKDVFFSESGKSKQYLKHADSGDESHPQNDASKACPENSLLQKSSLGNMDHANQKMTEINAGDKHKMQPNPGAITIERNKHRLDASLNNIEDTSSQTKKNKNKDVYQSQNDDHEANIIFDISKVESHHAAEKAQTISAVPAQNKQTVLHQINEEKIVTEPEDVSIQNGESELRQKIHLDFSTETVDASSENGEPELPISDGTIVKIPVGAPEVERDDSVNSNTQDNGEEILHCDSIDGPREEADRTPTNTILDNEVDKEVFNNFGEKYGIVNVDIMKFITEETEKNIRQENLHNLDVVSVDLLPEHDGDEMNNDDSKMLKNILNLMNFEIDVDLTPEEKLNVKFQDANDEQSDLSKELEERDYIAKLYAEEE